MARHDNRLIAALLLFAFVFVVYRMTEPMDGRKFSRQATDDVADGRRPPIHHVVGSLHEARGLPEMTGDDRRLPEMAGDYDLELGCKDQDPAANPKLKLISPPLWHELPAEERNTCVKVEIERYFKDSIMDNATPGVVDYKVCTYKNDSVHQFSISGQIQRGTPPQKATLVEILKHLERCEDCGFVDIGGNIGLMTLMAARMGRKVLAVEPMPSNMNKLANGVAAGNFRSQVALLQNAVSNFRISMGLKTVPDRAGITELACKSDCKAQGRKVCSRETVDTILMNDLSPLAADLGLKRVIMKVDVEMHEVEAFAKSSEFFNTVDVLAIFMEWKQFAGLKDPAHRASAQHLLDMLYARGFKHGIIDRVSPATFLGLDDWKKWGNDILLVKS